MTRRARTRDLVHRYQLEQRGRSAVIRLSAEVVDQLGNLETASAASTQKNSTRSAYSGASSIGSEFINDQIPLHQREVAKIQSHMKSFVKGMVRGREMNVLSVDGQLRACTCSFDRKLRNYNIVISKETRSIPLAKFREVFQGTEPEDIATPLDELCATMAFLGTFPGRSKSAAALTERSHAGDAAGAGEEREQRDVAPALLPGAHGQPETSEPGRDPVLLGGLPGVLLEQYFFDFGMLRSAAAALGRLHLSEQDDH
ncbi:unnamed protein product [Symbiodinium sp. KB8]|nr:unnamed protein product [Symbiodinium sp. KB8]